jgi:hypothetical protein
MGALRYPTDVHMMCRNQRHLQSPLPPGSVKLALPRLGTDITGRPALKQSRRIDPAGCAGSSARRNFLFTTWRASAPAPTYVCRVTFQIAGVFMPTIKQPDAFKQGLGVALFGLVIAGVCAGAWFMWQDRYWIAQKGPTEITLAQLAALEDPSQLPSPWVKVTFDKAIDTGVAMEELRAGSSTIKYKFLLFQAGDRWMVATAPDDFQGNTLSGEVYHSTNPQDIEAFAEIFLKNKEVHGGRLFPFEFRADIDFGDNWKWFAYIVGGFGGFALLLALGGIHVLLQAFREPAGGVPAYGMRTSRDDEQDDQWEEEYEEAEA